MNILLANPRGFCAGVDRAIEIVNRALELFGAPIYVKHEVVHNKFVVDDLKAKGAVFIAGEAHGFTLQHNTQLEVYWLSPQLTEAQLQEYPQNINSASRIADQVLEAIKHYVKHADLNNSPLITKQEFAHTGTPLSALVAGENSLVLTVRDYLRTTFKLPKALLYAVPYWRNGQDEEGYHQQRHTIMDEEY